LNRRFGVEADFSGAYRGSFLHDYTYTFGPVISLRTDHFTPFAHALFGGARFGTANAFCVALGGGLDVRVNDRVAVRLFQADWLSFSERGVTFNRNGRISTGVVIHF
jgi:hypothetical protein